MGLTDYMSRNPAGLTIPSSKYVRENEVASMNLFITNLELNDNLTLSNLVKQKRASNRLTKKRAKTEKRLVQVKLSAFPNSKKLESGEPDQLYIIQSIKKSPSTHSDTIKPNGNTNVVNLTQIT